MKQKVIVKKSFPLRATDTFFQAFKGASAISILRIALVSRSIVPNLSNNLKRHAMQI
jgi:hypothetical protein